MSRKKNECLKKLINELINEGSLGLPKEFSSPIVRKSKHLGQTLSRKRIKKIESEIISPRLEENKSGKIYINHMPNTGKITPNQLIKIHSNILTQCEAVNSPKLQNTNKFSGKGKSGRTSTISMIEETPHVSYMAPSLFQNQLGGMRVSEHTKSLKSTVGKVKEQISKTVIESGESTITPRTDISITAGTSSGCGLERVKPYYPSKCQITFPKPNEYPQIRYSPPHNNSYTKRGSTNTLEKSIKSIKTIKSITPMRLSANMLGRRYTPKTASSTNLNMNKLDRKQRLDHRDRSNSNTSRKPIPYDVRNHIKTFYAKEGCAQRKIKHIMHKRIISNKKGLLTHTMGEGYATFYANSSFLTPIRSNCSLYNNSHINKNMDNQKKRIIFPKLCQQVL